MSTRYSQRAPKRSALFIAVAIALGAVAVPSATAQASGQKDQADANKNLPAAGSTGQTKKDDTDAAPTVGLETIVVTAQRREERAQTVPIAMTAFSGTQLERRNIADALSLTQYVPNFVAANNTGLGTANTYFIRGVGDTESLASKDPPVGTYIDDILFSRQSANNFALFDVDRIEVLRGPQGTLFGRNTTGGSVNVHLKKPSTTMKGYAEASIGRFNHYGYRASIDLPFSETVLTKLSAYYNEDRGYVKNSFTGETLNGRENSGGRIGIRAFISEGLLWDGFALRMNSAGTNLVNFKCDPINPSNCDSRYATTGLRVNNGGASQYPSIVLANGKANIPLGNETNTDILGSNLAISVGESTINLITGYVDTKQRYNLDFFDGRAAPGYTYVSDPVTGRPSAYNIANNVTSGGAVRGRPGGFAIAADAVSEQFTQEAKISGAGLFGFVDYVGGFFFMKEKNYSDFADIVSGTGPNALPPAAPFTTTLLADRTLRNTTEAWAAYTQLDFNFTNKIKLTTGVRFTDEKKEYNYSDNRPQCQVTPVPATCVDNANFINVDNDLNPATPTINIPRNQGIKIWTPRLALNYKHSDDVMMYASATRGFKSGGQSARSTAVRLLLPFEAETVWSYELGTRTEWFDRKLRINVTSFYAITENLQGGSAFVTTNLATGAQTLSFVTRNFADFENKGLEFDITAVPVKGLNLNFAGGYQKAKYKLDANRKDAYGTVSTFDQQRECLAALAGQPSPRGDTRLAALRAQSSCGNGVVTPTGAIADPVRTPKWTLSGGASYDIPVEGLSSLITPSINFSYVSAHEVGSANVSIWRSASGVLNASRDGEFVTGSFSDAHTIVNAGISFRTNNRLWSGSLDCTNCTDKAYSSAALSNFSYLNEPRKWTFKIKRVF
jgi:iron complex outermembrane recepter protein